jgi:signal transduction histidine kinase
MTVLNLRRLRGRLTLLFGVSSALAVAVLAVLAARSGEARIRAAAAAELQTRVAGLAATAHPANPPKDESDAWLVDLATKRTIRLGETGLEPPLLTIAETAKQDGTATSRESQDGNAYILSAHPGQDGTVAVAARYLDDVSRSVSSLRLRIGTTAGGIMLCTLAAGWWLAGRSLRPARRILNQQTDFLADAAHQLRTPLTIIQASASQTLTRPRTAEEYAAALSEIRAAAQRAGAGVGQLLDLARLEAGQLPLRTGPFRLDLLVEELVAEQPADGATIDVAETSPVVIEGDAALLGQAIGNVLDNALRYGSMVWVQMEHHDRQVTLEVADNGPGIAPELLATVFERYRGNGAGGTGLGLAIVHSIVTAHGGRTEAANRPEGGAVIRLHLPDRRHRP